MIIQVVMTIEKAAMYFQFEFSSRTTVYAHALWLLRVIALVHPSRHVELTKVSLIHVFIKVQTPTLGTLVESMSEILRK
jgi:hypothetical protein